MVESSAKSSAKARNYGPDRQRGCADDIGALGGRTGANIRTVSARHRPFRPE